MAKKNEVESFLENNHIFTKKDYYLMIAGLVGVVVVWGLGVTMIFILMG